MDLLYLISGLSFVLALFVSQYISLRLPRPLIACLTGASSLFMAYFLFAAYRLNFRHSDAEWPRPSPYPDQFVQKLLSNWEPTSEERFMRPATFPPASDTQPGMVETYWIIFLLALLATILAGICVGLFLKARDQKDG